MNLETRAISGGYLFVGAAERPTHARADLLPSSLWTPTSCICELYPDFWSYPWCNPTQSQIDTAMNALGLSSADLQPIQDWVGKHFERGEVGFPGTFFRRELALEFSERFLLGGPELKLIGIGLPEAYVAEFLEEGAPGASEGVPGIYQAVEARTQLDEGGASLGFEPLGYESGSFHSFVCNSLEKDYSQVLNLKLNRHGRFTDLAACESAVEFTRRDSTGAEPSLWQPWQVVEYPKTKT